MWKTVPLRLGLTLALVVLLALCAVGVVASGVVAERAGNLLGIGSTGVWMWDIAKWPVLAVLVSLTFALLHWASPAFWCGCGSLTPPSCWARNSTRNWPGVNASKLASQQSRNRSCLRATPAR